MELEMDKCVFCAEYTTVISARDSNLYFRLMNKNTFECNNLPEKEFKQLFHNKKLCISCAYGLEKVTTLIDHIINNTDEYFSKNPSKSNCYWCHEFSDCLIPHENVTKPFQQKITIFVKSVTKKDMKFRAWQICLQCSVSISLWRDIADKISNLQSGNINVVIVSDDIEIKSPTTRSKRSSRSVDKTEVSNKKIKVQKDVKTSILKTEVSKKKRRTEEINDNIPISKTPKIKIKFKFSPIKKKSTQKKVSITNKRKSEEHHLDNKLKHLKTVKNESKELNLSKNITGDQKMMLGIPYIKINSATESDDSYIEIVDASTSSDTTKPPRRINRSSYKNENNFKLSDLKKGHLGIDLPKTRSRMSVNKAIDESDIKNEKKISVSMQKENIKSKTKETNKKFLGNQEDIYNCTICKRGFTSRCDTKLHELEHNISFSPIIVLDNCVDNNIHNNKSFDKQNDSSSENDEENENSQENLEERLLSDEEDASERSDENKSGEKEDNDSEEKVESDEEKIESDEEKVESDEEKVESNEEKSVENVESDAEKSEINDESDEGKSEEKVESDAEKVESDDEKVKSDDEKGKSDEEKAESDEERAESDEKQSEEKVETDEEIVENDVEKVEGDEEKVESDVEKSEEKVESIAGKSEKNIEIDEDNSTKKLANKKDKLEKLSEKDEDKSEEKVESDEEEIEEIKDSDEDKSTKKLANKEDKCDEISEEEEDKSEEISKNTKQISKKKENISKENEDISEEEIETEVILVDNEDNSKEKIIDDKPEENESCIEEISAKKQTKNDNLSKKKLKANQEDKTQDIISNEETTNQNIGKAQIENENDENSIKVTEKKGSSKNGKIEENVQKDDTVVEIKTKEKTKKNIQKEKNVNNEDASENEESSNDLNEKRLGCKTNITGTPLSSKSSDSESQSMHLSVDSPILNGKRGNENDKQNTTSKYSLVESFLEDLGA